MGLINARNLRMAKALLDKNRHMVGDVVGKAAIQVDKLSGGKTSDLTTKIEQAARNYSAPAIGPDGKPVGDKPLVSSNASTDTEGSSAIIDVESTETSSTSSTSNRDEPANDDTARPDGH